MGKKLLQLTIFLIGSLCLAENAPVPEAPTIVVQETSAHEVSIPAPPITEPAHEVSLKTPTNGSISIPAPLAKRQIEESVGSLMDVPKTLDMALGQFKVNGVTCVLNHAYSSETIDPLNETRPKYEFLLTAQPIPAKSFNDKDSLLSIAPKNQCWFYSEIETRISLNPIKVFVPGGEPLQFSDSVQKFLRKKLDVQDDLMAGTLFFKEPMIFDTVQVTGQFSFRSQFRNLGQSTFSILKKAKYVDKDTFAAYKTYAGLFDSAKSRNIASVPSTDANVAAENVSEIPNKINFKYGFYNQKEHSAAVIVEGYYTDSAEKKYGVILMNEKNGQWQKGQEKWFNQIPEWAENKSKIQAAKK